MAPSCTVIFAGNDLQEALAELAERHARPGAVLEQQIDQQRASLFELERLNQIVQARYVEESISVLVAGEKRKQLLLVRICGERAGRR